jgi:Sigma-70, region 4
MTPARRRAFRRADRKVRTIVDRYTGCLADLPTRQRRVLRLRAGVGPPPPASRTTVARRLDLGMAQVRRAERRGLRALRRAGQGGCAAPGSVDGFAGGADSAGGEPATVLASDAIAAAMTRAGGGGDGGSSGSGPGGDAGSGSGSGKDSVANGNGGGSGGVKGATAIRPAQRDGATDITLLLLFAILAGIAAFGAWRLHRSRDTATG